MLDYERKLLILYFDKSEENILKEILSGIQKGTKEHKIRNCILDNTRFIFWQKDWGGCIRVKEYLT